MNPGRHFRIGRPHWKRLCRRVGELTGARESLCSSPLDPDVEAEARRMARILLERQGESLPEDAERQDFQRVDVGSARDHTAQPGPERRTNAWLRGTSALGEMLGIDFGGLGDMALYRASDRLLRHRTEIERHLFDRATGLFSLQPTVAFHDLANTYFEGRASGPVRWWSWTAAWPTGRTGPG